MELEPDNLLNPCGFGGGSFARAQSFQRRAHRQTFIELSAIVTTCNSPLSMLQPMLLRSQWDSLRRAVAVTGAIAGTDTGCKGCRTGKEDGSTVRLPGSAPCFRSWLQKRRLRPEEMTGFTRLAVERRRAEDRAKQAIPPERDTGSTGDAELAAKPWRQK
ncbi:hypothetical protein EXIGLDRAFT_208951 [Exidia glandulosa HHB12029]|uniref:Uncharacterized protein n=1 Tax=Exidia glandulosa HHB12029 TaxID=1314781 RepID=A0A165EKH8_EXIGL|nr:hypothetical protein EXIGLDRAFT_208951 [Exidia glandulosa HHB12029]